MDSITQAALGALCGEILLSKKIGAKGALWGALFGTIPDLDIIAFFWLDAAEQLRSHRGLSHSLFIMPIASVIFGWILSKIHSKKKVSFKLAMGFVFAAWSTHVLIDCFNTYGTQIFEPFSDYRFSMNVMFIIDPFFTVPMILGLIFSVILFRNKRKLRVFTHWVTAIWLCLYFMASITLKVIADRHFAEQFHNYGVTPIRTMSAPTPLNIFAWRGVAQDADRFYVTYWSIFDSKTRVYDIEEIKTGRHHERKFYASKEFRSIQWFSRGWRKSYVVEGEPNSLYIALVKIGEMRVADSDGNQLFMPSFLWKIEKDGENYQLTRPYKMSKDFTKNDIGKTLKNLTSRVAGGEPKWMEGTWIWDKKKK